MKPSILLLALLSLVAALAPGKAVAWERKGKMALIPSGSYVPFFSEEVTGQPTTRKPITVKAFLMDRYPVTLIKFQKFVTLNPDWRRSQVKRLFADEGYLKSWVSDLDFGSQERPHSPVTQVSWFAASAYCEWRGKRLPTNDEWEYVSFDLGRHRKQTQRRALDWFSKPNPIHLAMVGSTFKNGFGIYDLNGLIWEWTLDFNSSVSGDGAETQYCGLGAEKASDSTDYVAYERFALRSSLKADYTTSNLGFRCVKELAP